MALTQPPLAFARLGTTGQYATPSATENINASGALILHVKNSGASGTVTPQDPGFTPAGSAASNAAITIPATTGDKFIYLPASLINASGQIQVQFATGTYSAALFFAAS